MKKKFNNVNILVGFLAALVSIIGFTMMIMPKSSNNITGKWHMSSKISNADKKAYIGAEVQWDMFLTENNNSVKGSAEKILINNIPVDYKQRTALEFEGVIKNNKLFLNYIENGKIRKTFGLIEVVIQKNKLLGTFAQTASNTKGTIEAYKMD